MKKKTTYTKLVLQIVLLILSVALAIGLLYAQYLKSSTVETISKKNAQKTTKLVFQTLYSAMEKGWTKEEIEAIIYRLNNVDNNLQVNVYRSKTVEKEYGTIKDNIQYSDENIQKVLKNHTDEFFIDGSLVNYYNPLFAQTQCLTCHKTAKLGDTLGIINIKYSVNSLQSSLSSVINFFIIFLILFSILIFISLFTNLNKYLIKPTQDFLINIKNISKHKDIKQRINIENDITEIDTMQNLFNEMLDSIEHQFYFNNLTLLPNRIRLLELLETTKNGVLMILDIDNFEKINNLYGEKKGDNILKETANLLKNNIPKNAMLFKLQADEYAILYNVDNAYEDVEDFAKHINKVVENHQFKISKETISINVTIGIAVGSNILLTNADIALKHAKEKKAKYLIYDISMNAEYEYNQYMKWSKRVKDAINNDNIVPLFQPIVNTKTRQIEKYEALIRMKDQDGLYIQPKYFLDYAKKNKLYNMLTPIMIDKSLKVLKNIDTSISINISATDIADREIYNNIIEKLENSRYSNKIIFEILETENIENFDLVSNFIKNIKKYGSRVAIDDFGTGYSNFKHLTNLKVDFIKIDSSMIKDIDKNQKTRLATQTIIDFANKMGIKTVAEFVHSEDVFNVVEKLGIDYAQGYYFGEPRELD